ncbi:MAG: hypothetical protein SFZ23_04105 [Planctomycetota bacterium]|nr:hypothetical protein [Planctomycetota bacterium]
MSFAELRRKSETPETTDSAPGPISYGWRYSRVKVSGHSPDSLGPATPWGMLLPWGAFAVVGAVVLIGLLVIRAVAGPTWLAFVPGGLVGIALAIWSLRFGLRTKRITLQFIRQPPPVDDSVRVRCAGNAVAIQEVKALGPPEGVGSFEPKIYDAFFMVPASKKLFRWWIIITSIVGVAGVMGEVFIIARPLIPGFHVVYFYIIAVVSAIILAFLNPVYLRVVPGRLDVMRFRFRGRRASSVRSIDLRSVRMLVDLTTKRVFFDRVAGDNSERIECVGELGFEVCYNRTEFAHALLAAATTDAPTPDLPHDELIG